MICKPNFLFALLLFILIPTLCQGDQKQNTDDNPQLAEQWSGDYGEMVERKVIRVLVVPNKMFYFVDQGRHYGITVDFFKEFETYINEKEQSGTLKIKVIFLPVQRDQILPALAEGRGDIAAANLTITPERRELADFSAPLLTGVKEIVITGPDEKPLERLEDLSGRSLHLRPSSSYFQHLTKLNETFKAKGLAPVEIIEAEEFLEDADLLEMVNAGLIPAVIVDDHKARFWGQIFAHITLHPEVFVNEGGEIAWAFRKNSPQLEAVVNEFVQTIKKGTLLGNIVFKKYLKENKWARNSLSPKEQKKFQQVVDLFKTYADRYQFDYLMTGALAYQESQLDHSKSSQVGAVGIMQLLPATAADKNVGIPDIEKLEKNIHAGHKYLRFLQDRYFSDPEIDELNRYLFTFASYNAGPAKIAGLRQEAEKQGLDPTVWFQNVEVIAAKRIGRETVQYVSNIYKYYLSYKLAMNKAEKAAAAKQAP